VLLLELLLHLLLLRLDHVRHLLQALAQARQLLREGAPLAVAERAAVAARGRQRARNLRKGGRQARRAVKKASGISSKGLGGAHAHASAPPTWLAFSSCAPTGLRRSPMQLAESCGWAPRGAWR
jgi:hypothetical protein